MNLGYKKTYQISIPVPANIDAIGDQYIILRANSMEELQEFLQDARDETLRLMEDD